MLYSNPTSEEIRDAITSRAENFMDVIVPFDELKCESNENNDSVQFRYGLGLAEFNTQALNQLFSRIKFSPQFWKRLYEGGAYQLIVDNFNWCNENTAEVIANQRRNNDPSYLFRLNPNAPIELSEDEDEDEEEETLPSLRTPVRAVLSSSYSIFDDKELFPMLMDELDQDDNISYLSYEYDSYITRLHIKLKNTEVTHKNVTYFAGMIITNSEVGSSSIWIEPVVYRSGTIYVNRNSLQRQNVQMKIVHRGAIDRERVSNIFAECKEIAQIGIIQLVEAYETKINPNHALSLAKNITELPSRMATILQRRWEHEENLKLAEAAQAIAELAQELPLFQRAKIEQEAGKIIKLFDNFSARKIQMIEEELED